MDVNDINEKFKRCITQWNNKLVELDNRYPHNGRSYYAQNLSLNDLNYFITHFDSIGENHITDLIAYGNDVIQKLETITFKANPSRDEQIESMRNMREKVEEVKFPVHENKVFRGVGRVMIFLDFPMLSSVGRIGEFTAPFQTWSVDIPKMVIERINCYLDAFKSLIYYKRQNMYIDDPEVKYRQEPKDDPYEKYNSSARGGKKRTSRRGKKRTSRRTNKRRKSKRNLRRRV
jgi:hypothetical protein